MSLDGVKEPLFVELPSEDISVMRKFKNYYYDLHKWRDQTKGKGSIKKKADRTHVFKPT